MVLEDSSSRGYPVAASWFRTILADCDPKLAVLAQAKAHAQVP